MLLLVLDVTTNFFNIYPIFSFYVEEYLHVIIYSYNLQNKIGSLIHDSHKTPKILGIGLHIHNELDYN